MSMASGSCRPFLKFRMLNPSPRLISGIFLPPKRKKMIPRMISSSQNPKPNKTIPLRVPFVYSIPLRGYPNDPYLVSAVSWKIAYFYPWVTQIFYLLVAVKTSPWQESWPASGELLMKICGVTLRSPPQTGLKNTVFLTRKYSVYPIYRFEHLLYIDIQHPGASDRLQERPFHPKTEFFLTGITTEWYLYL